MVTAVSDVRKLLNSSREDFFRRSNVVATGVGYKVTESGLTSEPSLICSVSKKIPKSQLSSRDLIPKTIDGIATDVLDSGIIRAFSSQTQRVRPAPGGSSIAHTAVDMGTFGCLVKRRSDIFILSNNHVMADGNAARIGDTILQPGPEDGGENPADKIALLTDFVPIHFSREGGRPVAGSFFQRLVGLFGGQPRQKTNLVDAAIAQPLDDSFVERSILGLSEIVGVGKAELGMEVQKSGRSTGLKAATIQQIDVTVSVEFSGGRSARFSDQLITDPMSEPGDSGSAVLDKDGNLVGLLFAGSDSITLVNRIQNVFSALDVSL